MIIFDEKSLEQFYNEYKNSDCIIHIIPIDDTVHPCINKIAAIYVYLFDNKMEYLIPVNHYDSINKLKVNLNSSNKKYVLDRKSTSQLMPLKKLIDVNLINYFVNNEKLDIEKHFDTFYFNLYKKQISNLNYIIPLTILLKYCTYIKDKILNVINIYDDVENETAFRYYNKYALNSLTNLEKNGLFNIKENKLVYSQYNLYTSTGRPSNAFGGTNFAALNKTDGTRELFISRFRDNGKLVELDYDAHHIRLLAYLIDYKLPNVEHIHNYFGKIYFKKENLTENEYNESKQITFRQLYGTVQPEYKDIEFFNKIETLYDNLWKQYNNTGYILSPLFKKKIHKIVDVNKNKLINYYIQLTEAEYGFWCIKKIQDLLKNKKTKLILFTYDSYLFDFHNDEFDLIDNIKNILNIKEKFPVRIKTGTNYSDLK
ncbi:MAG: hypothetical protein M0R17_09225 [Candidatus Omnitrophica bacterium]|jgi:hypothetical protein|nr:hypothetical protein [Candidatus Omnitrophota bacterium]